MSSASLHVEDQRIPPVRGLIPLHNARGQIIPDLDVRRCRELIANETIAAGMLPKVDAALEALEAGVGKVHIVDGRMPHSVLLEIYSNKGVGTEISDDEG